MCLLPLSQSWLPYIPVEEDNCCAELYSYTGQPIPVKVSITVDVDYSQQHYKNLELLVVQGPRLLKLDEVRFFEDNTTQLVDHQDVHI